MVFVPLQSILSTIFSTVITVFIFTLKLDHSAHHLKPSKGFLSHSKWKPKSLQWLRRHYSFDSLMSQIWSLTILLPTCSVPAPSPMLFLKREKACSYFKSFYPCCTLLLKCPSLRYTRSSSHFLLYSSVMVSVKSTLKTLFK